MVNLKQRNNRILLIENDMNNPIDIPLKFKQSPVIHREDKVVYGSSELKYYVYKDGVIVFMGAYVPNKDRGKGYFSRLVDTLISRYGDNYEYHVTITEPYLKSTLERKGFRITQSAIRYWGLVDNGMNLKREKLCGSNKI